MPGFIGELVGVYIIIHSSQFSKLDYVHVPYDHIMVSLFIFRVNTFNDICGIPLEVHTFIYWVVLSLLC